jgi:hypothetical protein
VSGYSWSSHSHLGYFHVTRIACITNTDFPGLHLCCLPVTYALLESLFSLRDCYSTNPVDTENHGILSVSANPAENLFKQRLIKGWRMFPPTATRVDQTE